MHFPVSSLILGILVTLLSTAAAAYLPNTQRYAPSSDSQSSATASASRRTGEADRQTSPVPPALPALTVNREASQVFQEARANRGMHSPEFLGHEISAREKKSPPPFIHRTSKPLGGQALPIQVHRTSSGLECKQKFQLRQDSVEGVGRQSPQIAQKASASIGRQAPQVDQEVRSLSGYGQVTSPSLKRSLGPRQLFPRIKPHIPPVVPQTEDVKMDFSLEPLTR